MKRLFLGFLILSALACRDRDENACNCKSEKWERNVVKETTTQNIISSTDWQVVSSTPYGTDCNTNGNTIGSGSENTHYLGNNQYSQTEFKYLIKCN